MNFKYQSMTRLWIGFTAFLAGFVYQVFCQEPATEFAPSVSAICKSSSMIIKVVFNNSYSGAIHAKDFRNPNCMVLGNTSNTVSLTLNLHAQPGHSNYCGIETNNRTKERQVQLAVRVHKTLELADDKFYVITCGKTGFTRDDNSHAILKFIENGQRVQETVYGRKYTIVVDVPNPNNTNGILVTSCFAFDKKNTSIPLIDERGCPIDPQIIQKFKPNLEDGTASTVLKSMFKFPEGSEVHIQCKVTQCLNKCTEADVCPPLIAGFIKGGKSYNSSDESVLAATTVFVLDPSQAPIISPICEETSVRPAWLLWLAIALGILFLIMLLMNIFLCTAMSCSCARTEIIEKEPSIIEEYDPYRSWHGSQYGSRYSLHGRDGHNKGYTSGGSTIHSNRSLPIETDHYAIVHSRPGSRYSGMHGHRSRGPPSNL